MVQKDKIPDNKSLECHEVMKIHKFFSDNKVKSLKAKEVNEGVGFKVEKTSEK